MPRRDLSLAEKVALLGHIKSLPPNTSHRRLAGITGVPKSTIARVIQQQDELLEEFASREGQQGTTSQKRKREGKDPDVDDALIHWFYTVSGRGVRISGPVLKTKAEELAEKLGHKDFRATDGWLSRWKARHHIRLKKSHGSSGDSAEQWKCAQLPKLLQRFHADDIYNATETGLFYRTTPDGSLSYNHAKLLATEEETDRLTVFCCSNMSGTDKRKLLVVGKSSKPRCLKGLEMDSLPVVYRANRHAWMTSGIFKEWLTNWDVELRRETRKVLLLVDNCAAHPYVDQLENIHLEFLPPNTMSLVQPMDMGIVKNLKTLYRGKLANFILEAIEENLLTPSSTAEEVSAEVDLLQAMHFVADSWREVRSTTIRNCFVQCGFWHSGLEMRNNTTDGEDDAIFEVQYIENYEEFARIENGLQCYDENEDWEEAIVQLISAKRQKTSEDDRESDGDEEASDSEQVTNQDARKCIATLRRYFMQQGNEDGPTAALDACADFVQLQSIKTIRQGTLAKFLQQH